MCLKIYALNMELQRENLSIAALNLLDQVTYKKFENAINNSQADTEKALLRAINNFWGEYRQKLNDMVDNNEARASLEKLEALSDKFNNLVNTNTNTTLSDIDSDNWYQYLEHVPKESRKEVKDILKDIRDLKKNYPPLQASTIFNRYMYELRGNEIGKDCQKRAFESFRSACENLRKVPNWTGDTIVYYNSYTSAAFNRSNGLYPLSAEMRVEGIDFSCDKIPFIKFIHGGAKLILYREANRFYMRAFADEKKQTVTPKETPVKAAELPLTRNSYEQAEALPPIPAGVEATRAGINERVTEGGFSSVGGVERYFGDIQERAKEIAERQLREQENQGPKLTLRIPPRDTGQNPYRNNKASYGSLSSTGDWKTKDKA